MYCRQNLEKCCFGNNLPDFAEEYKFYVCNTDPSSGTGDHLAMLPATAEGEEYFDSLRGAIKHNLLFPKFN